MVSGGHGEDVLSAGLNDGAFECHESPPGLQGQQQGLTLVLQVLETATEIAVSLTMAGSRYR